MGRPVAKLGISKSALNSLFSPEWQAALAPVPELGMLATVTIYDPEATEAGWVPGEGMVTKPATPWANKIKARIQPIRNTQYVQGDRLQAVRVSISWDEEFNGDVGVGFVMEVSDGGPLDPGNEILNYTCIETMDSSNHVERTLVFEVNYKYRVEE